MGKGRNEQETYAREMGFDQAIAYDASNNAIYVGRAFPGASKADAKWQIYKMEYDANNNMTTLRWAATSSTTQASDGFDKIWDNRASYYYGGI